VRAIRNAVSELLGLVVEDGYVAIGALLALAVAYALTRDRFLGPVQLVGWILVALVAVALMGSLVRAARRHRDAAGSGRGSGDG
jgi:apolipoprotein N-acyltransferase